MPRSSASRATACRRASRWRRSTTVRAPPRRPRQPAETRRDTGADAVRGRSRPALWPFGGGDKQADADRRQPEAPGAGNRAAQGRAGQHGSARASNTRNFSRCRARPATCAPNPCAGSPICIWPRARRAIWPAMTAGSEANYRQAIALYRQYLAEFPGPARCRHRAVRAVARPRWRWASPTRRSPSSTTSCSAFRRAPSPARRSSAAASGCS